MRRIGKRFAERIAAHGGTMVGYQFPQINENFRMTIVLAEPNGLFPRTAELLWVALPTIRTMTIPVSSSNETVLRFVIKFLLGQIGKLPTHY
jgi:hypothetical protein